jgi:hypothetical protein
MIFLKKIIIKKKIKHKFLQLFKNGKKNCDKKKIILLEFGNYAFQHIAAAYLCDIISKKFQAKIVAYPGYQLLSSSLNQSFVKKIIWKIGNLFSINTFGIHNSFGTSDIFWPKINNQINSKALKEFINYESIIKSKVDLENYKINNILIGDLIYDSFLKKTQYPTLDINSIEFKDFFLDSLKLFYFWQNYFKTHDIKSLVLYHSVYISALPLRFAVVKKIPTYVFTMDRLYNLNNERKFYGLEYLDYKKKFKIFTKNKKKEIHNFSKRKLSNRFKGKMSGDMIYLSKTAYGKLNKRRVLKKTNKMKILIAPHSFCDSPHVFGNNFFPDQYEWLDNLGKISNQTDYDWYIKCHPNFTTYHDNTVHLIKKFVNKYPKIKYLKSNTSHNQLIREGINYVLTVLGTIAGEYPYFGVGAINASSNNPHNKYTFSITPKNRNEYLQLIKKLKLSKIIIKKNEVLEHYYMKNEYFSNRWFFNDINHVKKSLNGYENFFSNTMYQYWVKNFDFASHNKLYEKIKKFIDSKKYILVS